MGKYWSDPEDDIVIENYEHGVRHSADHCQTLLAQSNYYRTPWAIQQRAYEIKYGLRFKRKNVWVGWQIKRLHRYAGLLPPAQIAKKVGKDTGKAVIMYAWRNNISLDRHGETFTHKDIAEMLDVSENWVRRRVTIGVIVENNHRKQYQHHTVTTDQMRKYLREYPTELDDIIMKGGKPNMMLIVEILAGIISAKRPHSESGEGSEDED